MQANEVWAMKEDPQDLSRCCGQQCLFLAQANEASGA